MALWAWDIVVDNCAICRNHIMDLCMNDPLELGGVWSDVKDRHRMPSKSSISHERRVHSCLGYLQCRLSLSAQLLDKLMFINSTACVPLPLHFALAEDSASLSIRQQRLGIPEIWPVMRYERV